MATRRLLSSLLRQTVLKVDQNGLRYLSVMPRLNLSINSKNERFIIRRRFLSTEAPLSIEKKLLPKKEKMLALDWVLEGITPIFMKTPLKAIFEHVDENVEFEDKIYGYKLKGIRELNVHITKVRLYFRYKSPYNRTNYNGSYLFEDDNYIVLLWGLETMDSNIWNYLPSFITGRRVDPKIIEGALVFTLKNDGKIIKIVNRPIEDKDIKLAEEFVKLKSKQKEDSDREDRRKAEKELKEQLDIERRQQE